MRVIAKSTLVKFWVHPEYADAKSALQSWHDEAIKARWLTPQDIKAQAIPKCEYLRQPEGGIQHRGQ